MAALRYYQLDTIYPFLRQLKMENFRFFADIPLYTSNIHRQRFPCSPVPTWTYLLTLGPVGIWTALYQIEIEIA